MKRKAFIIGIIGVFLLVHPISAQTWSASKRLTWTSSDSWVPSIAISSSNNIHVVWFDNPHGNKEIYYKRSTNGGLLWASIKKITWNAGDSYSPVITVAPNNDIHLVWFDETPGNREIYYKRSTDEGITWESSKRLTWNSAWSVAPVVAVDSSNYIHVAWRDDTPGNSEIYYRRSTSGGTSWSTAKRITWNSGLSNLPVIAVDTSDNIHLIWYDDTPGNTEIYYRRSTNNGVSWEAAKRITWNAGGSLAPKIVVDSNDNIHLVWIDGTPGNGEIFYRKSTNGGVSWGAAKRITWNAGSSRFPTVAVDSNNHIHVVWEDDTNDCNWEIYHKKSTDGGASWAKFVRLTWNSGWSSYNNITVDSSNNIHVVWNDDTPGNYEIYHKKGEQ